MTRGDYLYTRLPLTRFRLSHAVPVPRSPHPCETVLIVDDDPDVRSALRELFEGEGYEVREAENGRAALDILERGLRPCVVLLDLMMPIMDGWDFRAEQVGHRDLTDVPIIIVTAAGFSEDSVRKQFGPIPFIPKPPEADRLVTTVRAAFRAGG